MWTKAFNRPYMAIWDGIVFGQKSDRLRLIEDDDDDIIRKHNFLLMMMITRYSGDIFV